MKRTLFFLGVLAMVIAGFLMTGCDSEVKPTRFYFYENLKVGSLKNDKTSALNDFSEKRAELIEEIQKVEPDFTEILSKDGTIIYGLKPKYPPKPGEPPLLPIPESLKIQVDKLRKIDVAAQNTLAQLDDLIDGASGDDCNNWCFHCAVSPGDLCRRTGVKCNPDLPIDGEEKYVREGNDGGTLDLCTDPPVACGPPREEGEILQDGQLIFFIISCNKLPPDDYRKTGIFVGNDLLVAMQAIPDEGDPFGFVRSTFQPLKTHTLFIPDPKNKKPFPVENAKLEIEVKGGEKISLPIRLGE